MRDREHPLHPGGRVPERVALVGDLHGSHIALRRAIEKTSGLVDILIVLGDYGYWTPGPGMDKWLGLQGRLLRESGQTLLWLDGNHEWHPGLNAIPVDPDTGLRKITNQIWHLPRSHRWQWGDRSYMSLGGAVSVDRDRRREGRDWWPEEVLSPDDVDRAISGGPVDVLLTHDAPSGVHIPGLDPGQWPADAIVHADAHRELLRGVVDAVRPRRVWAGHYHARWSDTLDLGWDAERPDWSGECVVRGLAHDQAAWRDNVAIIDVATGDPIPWDELES